MVTYLETTGLSMIDALGNLWYQFIELLPGVIGAIILMIIGYFIGAFFEAVIKGALIKAGLDHWVEKHERHKPLGHLQVSSVIGEAVKWYIFVIFLSPAAAMVRLGTISSFIHSVAVWLPNLIAGVLIFLFGLILADFAEERILRAKFKWVKFWGGLARVLILLFVLDVALTQIGIRIHIAEATYLIVLTGIVLAIALAVGIGFGLGLKDEAKGLLKKIK
ncbi:MAG: hypothetical protein ABIC91_04595 [Nanoarchaeota archaeon]